MKPRFACLVACAALAARAEDFPKLYNSEPGNPSPLSPAAALAKIRMPPGFQATLFAAEPEVQNPIAMAWDARGRLWIAENFTYAERAKRFDLSLHDRILIFEDGKGDGHATSRKVFTDSIQMLTSVLPGEGGVWAMCPPNLVFLPDRNGDDVPDGAPEVVLDGFTVAKENYHNFANGLKWGPDGWLYGRCGASCPGDVGAPGTPPELRVPLRGTMWRFHPQRKVFEALSFGTTNPWGHDWNADGELFFINTVNGHLWHGIPGAHYVRPHTRDPNPHAYELIDLHADHWHFDTGKSWTDSRDGKADAHGGGHSHIGAMIYQGDNWPAQYRGRLLTFNQHGRRLNCERLERSGSGYVGRHEPDAVFFDDPWARVIDLDYGPDGGVFVIDWSDTGECHDSTGVHRESGRIFKITCAATNAAAGVRGPVHLPGMSDADLVGLHRSPNEWFVRQARRQLVARASAGKDQYGAVGPLLALVAQGDADLSLRALWTLFAIGGTNERYLSELLRHQDERVRAQAVRLLSDAWPLDRIAGLAPEPAPASRSAALLPEFVRLAKEDPSGLVRLALASTLQRIDVSQRAELASALVARKEDAADHNLPLLVWYGLIPVAGADAAAVARTAGVCEWPATRRLAARRLAADLEKNPAPLNALLGAAVQKDAAFQTDVLNGLLEAFTGWRKATAPEAWPAFQKKLSAGADEMLQARINNLGALFGDGRAIDEVKHIATDSNAGIEARKVALQTLIDNRIEGLRPICESVLHTKYLNNVAVRGLALENDPALGAKMAAALKSFDRHERPTLISVLTTRPAWAQALLDAVEKGGVERGEITASFVRQIRSLNDEAVNRRLSAVWGEMRETPADKKKLIADLKARLKPDVLAKADKAQGKIMFTALCSACHTMYGQGGRIGPDLTGSQRDNLDYLLDNIVDPSAVVAADFRVTTLTLKDGRVLSGMIAARTDKTVTIKTATESLTLDRADVTVTQDSQLSMMPEGLLQALPPEQVNNLIAYLMAK